MRHLAYRCSGQRKRQPPGYRFETGRYDLFQVIYVCSGELIFTGRNHPTILGAGGIAILRQGSAFSLSCPVIGYRGVSFNASGKLPQAFLGGAETIRATTEIRTLARLMKQQFTAPGPESAAVLEALGRVMAWQSIRLSRKMRKLASGPQSGPEWARAARAALDANLYTATAAREILDSLPLSYRQLSRYFTGSYALSPKRYLLRAKMEEAKYLLAETALNVTAISMELGFSSSQHFATRFKTLAGVTPSGYRRCSQGKSG